MSNELMKTNEEMKHEHEGGRRMAMTMGGFVYVGVVLAATTLFLSFIMTAFPETAFASRAVMMVGGLLVGGSAIAFPVALHNWAVSGKHRQITIGLYYGEIAILAINTIVSFAALLYKNAGTPLPAWVAWYEPISVVSIVYVLFAWGTIFLLDPHIQLRAREMATMNRFDEKTISRMDEFLDSIEGEDAIMDAALARINERFRSQSTEKRHFGSGQLSLSSPNGHKPAEQISERTERFNLEERETVPTNRRGSQ